MTHTSCSQIGPTRAQLKVEGLPRRLDAAKKALKDIAVSSQIFFPHHGRLWTSSRSTKLLDDAVAAVST